MIKKPYSSVRKTVFWLHSNMDHTYFESLPSCTENSYLVGYVTSQHIVRFWLNCLSLCILSETCRSVNVWDNHVYKHDKRTCELNWSIANNCSDLQPAPNVWYITKEFVSSCADIQRSEPGAQDGEFILWLGWRKATVYCHNMDTSDPLVSNTVHHKSRKWNLNANFRILFWPQLVALTYWAESLIQMPWAMKQFC